MTPEEQFFIDWRESIEEYLEAYHNRPLDSTGIPRSSPLPASPSSLPEKTVVADTKKVADTLKEMVEE